jgi:hypothetical protein
MSLGRPRRREERRKSLRSLFDSISTGYEGGKMMKL